MSGATGERFEHTGGDEEPTDEVDPPWYRSGIPIVLADVLLTFGLVFLSGLYVNLADKRLGALARRLLPAERG